MERPYKSDRMFVAACRELINQYEPLFLYLIEEEEREMNVPIDGETAFEYAKKEILRQGRSEGMHRLLQLIHKNGKREPEEN